MVQSSAIIVAVLVALAPPLGYALIGYQYEASDARQKAQLSATQVARYIFQHPSLWQFHSVRLTETIGTNDSDAMRNIQRRIVRRDGKVLVSRGTVEARFSTVQRATIMVADDPLAELELEASLDPLLMRIGLAALISCGLGLLAYFAFRSLPLYALEKALGDLHRLQDRLVQTNQELTVQNLRLIEQDEALRQRSDQLASAQRLGKLGNWSYRLGDKDL